MMVWAVAQALEDMPGNGFAIFQIQADKLAKRILHLLLHNIVSNLLDNVF
jgi:hypothetical protein